MLDRDAYKELTLLPYEWRGHNASWILMAFRVDSKRRNKAAEPKIGPQCKPRVICMYTTYLESLLARVLAIAMFPPRYSRTWVAGSSLFIRSLTFANIFQFPRNLPTWIHGAHLVALLKWSASDCIGRILVRICCVYIMWKVSVK